MGTVNSPRYIWPMHDQRVKLTFLGTGTSQGVPVIGCRCAICASVDERDHRLRTSALVQVNGLNLLIDAGPDLRQQMLRAEVKKIDAVLFTHAHSDHIMGLDDVRPFNFMQRQHMPLYGNAFTLNAIKRVFAYAFDADPYPGAPMLVTREIDGPFEFNGVSIIPLPVEHGNMPTIGYRIGNVAYITDAKAIPPATLALLTNVHVLVLNALRMETHHSHFTLDEALAMVRQIAPKRAFFTHISHQLGLHAAISAQLPSNVQLAFDGLTV